MSHRLYGLLPDVDTAHRAVATLREAGLDEAALHVVARPGQAMGDPPEAGLLETSDLASSAGRGAAAGAATGVLAGLAALVFPPAGLVIGGGMVAATTAAGAGFGPWASSMIGISRDSDQMTAFESALDAGQILLMADGPTARTDELSRLIEAQHPYAFFSAGKLAGINGVQTGPGATAFTRIPRSTRLFASERTSPWIAPLVAE